MIDLNYSAMCTNKAGHRDAFSNEWRKAPRVSRGLLAQHSRLRRETISILCHTSLSYSGARFDIRAELLQW